MLEEQERRTHTRDHVPTELFSYDRTSHANVVPICENTESMSPPSFLSWPSVKQLFVEAGATTNNDETGHVDASKAQCSRVKEPAENADSSSPSDLDYFRVSSARLTSASTTGYSPRSRDSIPQRDGRQSISLTQHNGIRLINGYLDHIGIQHPFMDADQLRHLAQQCTRANETRYVSIAPKPGDGLSAKRQRLNRGAENGGRLLSSSIGEYALVMLCCALGEVALSHCPPLSADLPSIDEHDKASNQRQPGSQYFDTAARLIGHFIDGNDLVHAQIFLLAGLYKALTLRMKESSSWYSMAGRVLTYLVNRRNLLHSKEERLSGYRDALTPGQHCRTAEDDLVLRAAWTCVQLESELIPELHLPCSRLSDLTQSMSMPSSWIDNLGLAQQSDGCPNIESSQLSYAAQINLRRIRCQIRHQLYSAKCLESSLLQVNDSIKTLALSLQHWRSQLHADLQWEDRDNAPISIPLAQLRYAYWETKLLLLRPFIDYAIHILPTATNNQDLDSALRERGSNSTESHILRAVHHKCKTCHEAEIFSLAGLGIEAAKQSSTAFNGVSERRIMSNAQMVGHVQFTNVAMLVAARQSRCLYNSVTDLELVQMVTQTMNFHRELGSATARIEARLDVLRKLMNLCCTPRS